MSTATTALARRFMRPAWLIKYVGGNDLCDGWMVYSDGTRFALAKKKGSDAEYHLVEKHTAVLSVQDRSKHRLVWKGKLTRAGRHYIAVTLALSNAACRIMRADGKAQCTQCRKLIVLKEFESHPCKENDDEKDH